ncbi:MAG: GerAB/ArcD/ProY family transporter [Lachnospiraceae bacterium]
MFADNWKISLRQIERLLILDLFGLSSLLLPETLGKMTGADGIFCLILGMSGAGILLFLIKRTLMQIQKDYYSYLKENAGQLLGDVFMVFYLIYFISLSGFVLYQTTSLILAWLLPEGSYLWINILLLAFGGYGVIRGIEGRARVYEIIFWFLGVPLVFMLGLAVRKVNVDYWTPIVATSGGEILKGSMNVWILLLPLSTILFLRPYCKTPEKLALCGKHALITVTTINLIIYLILVGVFGHNTLQVFKRPVITLMSMINFTGGVFSSQGITMTFVWFFALFALFNTGIFQSNLLLKSMCHETQDRYSLLVVLLLILLCTGAFFENSMMTELFMTYQTWIVLPGMIGILLLLQGIVQIRKWCGRGKGGKVSCLKKVS